VKWRRWLVVIGALAALQMAILVVSERVNERRLSAGLPVRMERRSQPAPDLVVERVGAIPLQIPARRGEFQLIHFWATWCGPCRTELPALLEMARRQRGRIRVWAVSTDRDWSSVERFLNRRVTPEVVRDPTGAAADRYHVTGIPDSYLVGPDGRIVARFAGAQNWIGPEMEKVLEALLRES
jgi:thiol-disulfide isomerase/thioredoxin